jgi:hypothetical protein
LHDLDVCRVELLPLTNPYVVSGRMYIAELLDDLRFEFFAFIDDVPAGRMRLLPSSPCLPMQVAPHWAAPGSLAADFVTHDPVLRQPRASAAAAAADVRDCEVTEASVNVALSAGARRLHPFLGIVETAEAF